MEKKWNRSLRDTEIVIDLDKLAGNVEKIKRKIGPDTLLCAVVKANGYGHGVRELVPVIMEHGGSYLGVATLGEALEIREAYSDPEAYPILIMGPTPDRVLDLAVEQRITLTIYSIEQARLLNRIAEDRGCRARVHIKADTGFHRLGFDMFQKNETLDQICEISRMAGLTMEGLFTHMPLCGPSYDEAQYQLFDDMIRQLADRGVRFCYTHIADSIATVDYPAYHRNMVRVGAALYGMKSFELGDVDVEQILTFRTRIAQLHRIPAGEGVSYDHAWKAERETIVATLPFGYADGYPRTMRDKGYVTIQGIKCPLVGVLCMDQVMADVTELPDVKVGDPVIIYGSGANEMSIAEAARLVGSNKNEILARLMARPERVYIGKQEK